jgi:hypothetical protein
VAYAGGSGTAFDAGALVTAGPDAHNGPLAPHDLDDMDGMGELQALANPATRQTSSNFTFIGSITLSNDRSSTQHCQPARPGRSG